MNAASSFMNKTKGSLPSYKSEEVGQPVNEKPAGNTFGFLENFEPALSRRSNDTDERDFTEGEEHGDGGERCIGVLVVVLLIGSIASQAYGYTLLEKTFATGSLEWSENVLAGLGDAATSKLGELGKGVATTLQEVAQDAAGTLKDVGQQIGGAFGFKHRRDFSDPFTSDVNPFVTAVPVRSIQARSMHDAVPRSTRTHIDRHATDVASTTERVLADFPTPAPIQLAKRGEGETYSFEIAFNAKADENWPEPLQFVPDQIQRTMQMCIHSIYACKHLHFEEGLQDILSMTSYAFGLFVILVLLRLPIALGAVFKAFRTEKWAVWAYHPILLKVEAILHVIATIVSSVAVLIASVIIIGCRKAAFDTSDKLPFVHIKLTTAEDFAPIKPFIAACTLSLLVCLLDLANCFRIGAYAKKAKLCSKCKGLLDQDTSQNA